jgi:Tol biopolymer transport system component
MLYRIYAILGACFCLVSYHFANAQSVVAKDYFQLPIKPERTISFTTDEGTNMHVDISPDGKSILFTLLGDIYLIPSDGGAAKQLTRGLALNNYPIWSPDSKMIAYISDASGTSGLYVMDVASGSVRMIVSSTLERYYEFTEPYWVPDASAIISAGSLYHLAGGLLQLPEEYQNFLGFSRDGKYSYFRYSIGREVGVQQIDRKTGGKRRLVCSHDRDERYYLNAKISPDGRWLVYMTGSERTTRIDSLVIRDLHNGTEQLLAALNVTYPGYLPLQHYSFSDNSKQVYIGYAGKIHRISIENGENKIIPFLAHVNVELGSLNYNKLNVSLNSLEVKYTRYAQRSADGKHVVFQALNRIYIKDIPDGTPHVLVNQTVNQFHPVYSPDGKWVAYVTWEDAAGGHVWRVPASGGKPEQITRVPGQYLQPAWSPDGRLLVVVKGGFKLGDRDRGGGQMQILTISDRKVTTIEDSVPLFNKPVFSSDGRSVIFNKPSQDYSEIKLISKNIDSGDNDSHILATGLLGNDDFPVRQIIPSPDGRFIVFLYAESLYLTPLVDLAFPVKLYDKKQKLPVIRFAKGGFDPHWEEGGKTLSWSFGNHYYRVDPDKIVSTAIKHAVNTTSQGQGFSPVIQAEVIPDQQIPIGFSVPRNYGRGAVAFRNVRIITMEGHEVIGNGTVVIKDGRFTAVGETQKVEIPTGSKVYDLNGKTIMPGLVDMHSHMGVRSEIVPEQFAMYLANLAYGVTTARDVSSSHDMFGCGELIASGRMIGPRLYSVGSAIRKDRYSILDKNEADLIVENRASMGATLIKQYTQPARIQRQWLLMASEKYRLNMTNEGAGDLLKNIGMIKDGSSGVEHNPDFGYTYKDVIRLFAESGTFLCPTIQKSYSRRFEPRPMVFFRQKYLHSPPDKFKRFMPDSKIEDLKYDESINVNLDTTNPNFLPESQIDAAILHKGGKIVVGGHGEDQGIGTHFELFALQMGGISNLEAIREATLAGAEGLGIQDDVGSIRVGKIADLIILDKNPLEDIHNTLSIKYVMKDGILYEGDTLDEIWPQQKKCPEWRLKPNNR